VNEETDEQLMRRYVQSDDRGAFEALFRRYAPRLTGFFMRSVNDRTVANDLVQQTFLHFHRARKDFRIDAKVKPWLYTIAINVRRELFRRRYRKPETQYDVEKHPEPSVAPDASTAQQRTVRRAMAELSDSQREVVLLHWYEGWTFREISEMVGASHSAVKVRAHRAYKVLRDILGEDDLS